MTTMKMKKLIGSALLGATIVGGVASVGAGVASADPGPNWNIQHDHRGDRPVNRPIDNRWHPRTNGEDPNWRPGPVFHQGGWHQPVWDAGRHHWGFWLGPIWIPIG
ncbi:hypothetical protein [Tsukamurella sp. NPDC003166]|uniref:hypothetical protein n=1 Tax=Tsukamurella sp. NPDC003166 TaxID=3154444 RepID=UPI0033A5123A